jgi:hypothetical protein
MRTGNFFDIIERSKLIMRTGSLLGIIVRNKRMIRGYKEVPTSRPKVIRVGRVIQNFLL